MIRTLITLAATGGLLLSSTAAAAQDKCIPREEARAVITSFLPDIVRGLRDRCSARLARNAALIKSETRIVDVFEPAADRAWPKAEGIVPIFVGQDLPDGVSLSLLRPFLGNLVASMIGEQVEDGDCETVGEIYAALTPLPPENLSRVVLALYLSDRNGKTKERAPFEICGK